MEDEGSSWFSWDNPSYRWLLIGFFMVLLVAGLMYMGAVYACMGSGAKLGFAKGVPYCAKVINLGFCEAIDGGYYVDIINSSKGG